MTEWLLGCEAGSGGMGFVAVTSFIMKTRGLPCTKIGKTLGYVVVLFFPMQDSNTRDSPLCSE